MRVKLSIIYSAYGTTHKMAQRVAETAEKYGAEVRLRHVAETAPKEVYESVDRWREHVAAVADQCRLLRRHTPRYGSQVT